MNSYEREGQKMKADMGKKASTRIFCPACRQAFQGENADRDYKEHWKETHQGKVRE